MQLKALSSGKPLKLIDEAVCIDTRDKFIKPGVAKEVSLCQSPQWTYAALPCALSLQLDHLFSPGQQSSQGFCKHWVQGLLLHIPTWAD